MVRNRWFVWLIVCVFVLAACSGSNDNGQTDATKGGEDVVLTMWLFGSTGYPDLAKEYMEENPHIKIEFQEIEMADHHNNLFTALSAGSGAPDLALIEVTEIERYREAQDQFYNLYDLGGRDVKDDYLDWVWSVAESKDGDFLFGLPTDIGPTVMFYRVDVLEEAGLPTAPDELSAMLQTWDDYENMAAQVYEKTGKPIVDSPELIFNALRDQAPVHYFDEDDQLALETEPYVKEAFDYTANLIQQGYVGNLTLWTPEWGSGMAEGNYATLLAPAWMQGVIKGNAPHAEGKWSITTMPEGAGNWGGSFVTIPKQSEHPEEAFAFASWLLSPEGQIKAFSNMGLFPSTPAAYEDEEFKQYTDDYFGGINTAAVFAEAAEQVRNVYKGKDYGAVNEELLAALHNVNDNGTDPEKEWQDALQRIEQRISR